MARMHTCMHTTLILIPKNNASRDNKKCKHFTTSIAIIKQSDRLVLIISSSSFGWMRRCCSCGMHCCAITEIVSMV